MVTLAKKEGRIAQDQLTQQIFSACRWVVPIRHIGLIAKVSEALLTKVPHAICARLKTAVLEGINPQNRIQHREPADAGIEDANGKRLRLAAIGRGIERPQRIAARMLRLMGLNRLHGIIGFCQKGHRNEAKEGEATRHGSMLPADA